MSTTERTGPPQSIPTLTEIVAVPSAGRDPAPPSSTSLAAPPATPAASALHPMIAGNAGPAAVTSASPAPLSAATRQPPASAPPASVPHAATSGVSSSEADMVDRILHDLLGQIEQVLEYRVRELLTPILTRTADGLVRDARNELSRALRDVVARAVAQEMQRQRSSQPRVD